MGRILLSIRAYNVFTTEDNRSIWLNGPMTVSQPGYNAEKKLVLLSWLKVWLESILRGISPQTNWLAVGDPYSFQIQRRAGQKKCRIWILVRMLSVQMACFRHFRRRREEECQPVGFSLQSKAQKLKYFFSNLCDQWIKWLFLQQHPFPFRNTRSPNSSSALCSVWLEMFWPETLKETSWLGENLPQMSKHSAKGPKVSAAYKSKLYWIISVEANQQIRLKCFVGLRNKNSNLKLEFEEVTPMAPPRGSRRGRSLFINLHRLMKQKLSLTRVKFDISIQRIPDVKLSGVLAVEITVFRMQTCHVKVFFFVLHTKILKIVVQSMVYTETLSNAHHSVVCCRLNFFLS